MSRLLWFAFGLACGLVATSLYQPHSKSKQSKESDHVTKTQPPTEPPLPLALPSPVSPVAAVIVVETVTERRSQKDVLTMIANFKTADQIIYETNRAARELFNGR